MYCDAFVVARYEYGVSSQPASGVAVQRGAELAERLVAVGDLPEEEVGLRAHAGRRVRAQVVEAVGEVLDDLGEGVLAGLALLDGQPPPRRVDAVERVRDVLALPRREC